ncbi:hypothetical protein DUHN55_21460 [Helicobacter pylori]
MSQGLNTAQNLVLAVLAARYSSAAGYGAWGIAFAVFVVSQNLTRSIVSTPQLIDEPESKRHDGAGLGASLILSLPLALIVACCVFALPGQLREMTWAIAGVLPFVLGHDALRYTAIRNVQDKRLVGLDAMWLFTQLGLSAILVAAGHANATTLTIAWGAGAAFACLVHCLAYRVACAPSDGFRLLREHRRAGGLMAVETLLGSVPVNAVPAVVGATLGLTAAGHFRGAMTIIGGIGLFVEGLTPIMTLEAARRLRQHDRAAGLIGAWSVVIAVLSLMYMLVFILLPDGVGGALLGDSWDGTSGILVMFMIAVVVRGPFTGAPIVLRCRRQFAAAIRLRLTTGWVQVAGPLVGALLGGITGAAWGYAAAALVNDAQALRALAQSSRNVAKHSPERKL